MVCGLVREPIARMYGENGTVLLLWNEHSTILREYTVGPLYEDTSLNRTSFSTPKYIPLLHALK